MSSTSTHTSGLRRPALHDPRWLSTKAPSPTVADAPIWVSTAKSPEEVRLNSNGDFHFHDAESVMDVDGFDVSWSEGTLWMSARTAGTPIRLTDFTPQSPCWVWDSEPKDWRFFSETTPTPWHRDWTHWLPGEENEKPVVTPENQRDAEQEDTYDYDAASQDAIRDRDASKLAPTDPETLGYERVTTGRIRRHDVLVMGDIRVFAAGYIGSSVENFNSVRGHYVARRKVAPAATPQAEPAQPQSGYGMLVPPRVPEGTPPAGYRWLVEGEIVSIGDVLIRKSCAPGLETIIGYKGQGIAEGAWAGHRVGDHFGDFNSSPFARRVEPCSSIPLPAEQRIRELEQALAESQENLAAAHKHASNLQGKIDRQTTELGRLNARLQNADAADRLLSKRTKILMDLSLTLGTLVTAWDYSELPEKVRELKETLDRRNETIVTRACELDELRRKLHKERIGITLALAGWKFTNSVVCADMSLEQKVRMLAEECENLRTDDTLRGHSAEQANRRCAGPA